MSVAVDLVLVDEARGDELVAEAESVGGLLKGLIATHPELTFVGSDEGRFHARARIEQWRKGTRWGLHQARPRILRPLRCSKAFF